MKHLLLAGWVLLIYQNGVIVEEVSGFKTRQDCVQAKHNQTKKAGCAREFKADPRRVPVQIESVKVGGWS